MKNSLLTTTTTPISSSVAAANSAARDLPLQRPKIFAVQNHQTMQLLKIAFLSETRGQRSHQIYLVFFSSPATTMTIALHLPPLNKLIKLIKD
jgi:hypothetical protein